MEMESFPSQKHIQSQQGGLENRCPKICEWLLSIGDVSESGKLKGCPVRKVAVGKRRVGEALYDTTASRRMWKGMALKSEAVMDNVGSWVWSSQAAPLPSILLKRFPTRSSACRFRDKFVQRSVITLPET